MSGAEQQTARALDAHMRGEEHTQTHDSAKRAKLQAIMLVNLPLQTNLRQHKIRAMRAYEQEIMLLNLSLQTSLRQHRIGRMRLAMRT